MQHYCQIFLFYFNKTKLLFQLLDRSNFTLSSMDLVQKKKKKAKQVV